MKRIFLLAIILILTTSICYAETPFEIYKNTDFEFEISYPHEWSVHVTSLQPGETFFGSHVGDLMVTITPTKDWKYIGIITNRIDNLISNDPYADQSLDNLITRSLKLSYFDISIELVSKSLVTVNDIKAMKVITRIPQGSFLGKSSELLDETYFIFHNNCWYEISFGGTPEDFKTNRKLYDKSLKSFNFLSK